MVDLGIKADLQFCSSMKLEFYELLQEYQNVVHTKRTKPLVSHPMSDYLNCKDVLRKLKE